MNATSIFRRCAVAAAIGMGSSIASAAPIIVSLVPSATHINIGEFVNIELRISGLADEILSAFDADLFFDPNVLNSASVTFFPGNFTTGSDYYFQADFAGPYTEFMAGSLHDDDTLAGFQQNSFTIGYWTFEGTDNGISLLDLGADLDFERNFVGRRFQTLDVTVQGTCVAVGDGQCPDRVVPEPAAYGLLGMAALLGGLATSRRRRDDKKSA